jgi:hypothetical protein
MVGGMECQQERIDKDHHAIAARKTTLRAT